MMLSMEVLPAPLGPMMARISPLRMSNETPVTALTPPNASDTFSTESSTSPAAMPCPAGALIPPLREAYELAARSCRTLQDGGNGDWIDVADLHARRQHALAPVLERHLGGNIGLGGAGIKRRDQGGIALRNEAAAHFLRPRDFAVIGVELLVQDEKAADLGAGHRVLVRER